MKKLLLVLMVVALASFLFVGCVPTVVDDGDDVVDDGTVVAMCPTVSVATEVEISGVKYIKGGSRVITVTFTVPTEPVSVYVGNDLKVAPTTSTEVVMYANADKTVYTGTTAFSTTVGDDCNEAYIYVDTCLECDFCKFPYTVDNQGPCSSIKIYEYPTTGCSCGGLNLRFVTPSAASECVITSYCGDYCSGLDTYTVDLYSANPFGTCCDIPCISPKATCSGTGCDIDCTLSCFNPNDYFTISGTDSKTFYGVVTLLDKVANKTRYYAQIDLDSGSNITAIREYAADGLCTDWTPALTPAGTTELEIGNDAGLYGTCIISA